MESDSSEIKEEEEAAAATANEELLQPPSSSRPSPHCLLMPRSELQTRADDHRLPIAAFRGR